MVLILFYILNYHIIQLFYLMRNFKFKIYCNFCWSVPLFILNIYLIHSYCKTAWLIEYLPLSNLILLELNWKYFMCKLSKYLIFHRECCEKLTANFVKQVIKAGFFWSKKTDYCNKLRKIISMINYFSLSYTFKEKCNCEVNMSF